MIRKWSYLISSNNTFYTGGNTNDFSPVWQNLNYKHFRVSVKLRKKKSSYTNLTKFIRKRQYIRKFRRRSFLLSLYVYKDWANLHLKLRQFWRFYQLNGLLRWEGSIIGNNLNSWALKKNIISTPFVSARLNSKVFLSRVNPNTTFFKSKSFLWNFSKYSTTDYSIAGLVIHGHSGLYTSTNPKHFELNNHYASYILLLNTINELTMVHIKTLYMSSTKLMLPLTIN